MNDDKKICEGCIRKTADLEQQLAVKQEEVFRLEGEIVALQDFVDENQTAYLQEELRNCRRLCYKEQHRNRQLEKTLASFKDKFQEYELTSIKMGEVF